MAIMAKKKRPHHSKKHKHQAKPTAVQASPKVIEQVKNEVNQQKAPMPSASSALSPVKERSDSLGYVKVEVKRVALLAAIFIAIELALWLILANTSLGPSVYRLIKI